MPPTTVAPKSSANWALSKATKNNCTAKPAGSNWETTAGGFAVRRLNSRDAIPGDTLVLSLDVGLQTLVEDLFGERRGALVALDPRNGEVLAMVSKPGYDINLFIGGIDQENWDMLNTSIDRPLLNRALRGTYPPGSTYKPFMGLAGLEWASARSTPPSRTTAAGPLVATPSARATPMGRPICAAPSSNRPTCTTTCWPTTWAWT